MSEQEVRARLERELHARITAAEWEDLREAQMLRMYAAGGYVSWDEFKDDAARTLDRLRRFLENTRREESGELLLETEVRDKAPEPAGVTDIPAPLSDRTAARAGALNALDHLRLGPTAWGSVMRTISSRVRPQGGFDEVLPQWVIELEIEAWVPADDVRSIYQNVRRGVLAEDTSPKTQPHTFRVAQFVWEEELRCGERPRWPILFKRWREQNPDDSSFTSWQAFHNCFKRGKKATPPRYKDSNEHIANESRRLKRLKEHREEGSWFGLQPY